ncbi:MAG: glycosyltransferase [Kiritimatiellae bacterium]|nr:glycosyltransferase [Kiritimatiellia bacterium]
MLTSIIVVAFNEAAALPRMKQAVDGLALPAGMTLETILIDGGSQDGTVAQAKQLKFTRVLELPQANIPVCRNAGLKAAQGDWLAFIDADCVLAPNWLIHAARLLSRYDQLILGWPAAPPSPGTWVQDAWHIHWMNKNPSVEMEEGERVVKQGGFRMITTRNMIMHRAVAEAVGGFDERLSTGEDTDFVFRASTQGIPVWGLPALASTHLGEPATLRAFYRQQVWHANRRAYQTILDRSGMKEGGNAPLFTALFLVAAMISIISLVAGLYNPLVGVGLFTLPAFLLLLAGRTSLRAKRPLMVAHLAILYGAYGIARSLDLLGFSPHKASWKAGKGTGR